MITTVSNNIDVALAVFSWVSEKLKLSASPMTSPLIPHDDFDYSVVAALKDKGAQEAIFQQYAQVVLSRQGLSQFPIQTHLLYRAQPRLSIHKELNMPMHSAAPERYYTDKWGRPIVYIEPDLLPVAEYLPWRLGQTCAQLILMSGRDFDQLSGYNYDYLMDAVMAYCGFGELSCMYNSGPNSLSSYVSLVLFWRCQGQTPEQIRSQVLMRRKFLSLDLLDQALEVCTSRESDILKLRQSMAQRGANMRLSA